MATVSTHDLPTAAGFLPGEHVRARAELGLLDDVAAERGEGRGRAGRTGGAAARRGAGRRDPSRPRRSWSWPCTRCWPAAARGWSLISPYDVVGEVRQPNLPGTVDEYPNWRLPLPVTLEELRTDPMVAEVVARLRRRR